MAHSINSTNSFPTIIPNGKIPFVSIEDIAQAAHDAIVNPESLGTNEPILIGPELLSYDEVRVYSSVVSQLNVKLLYPPSAGR